MKTLPRPSLTDALTALQTIRSSAPQDLKMSHVFMDDGTIKSGIVLVHRELSGPRALDDLDSAKAKLKRFLKATGLTITDLEHARDQFATRTSAGVVEAQPTKANEVSTVDVVEALIARDRRLQSRGDSPLNTVRAAHRDLLGQTVHITDLRKRLLIELGGAHQINDRLLKIPKLPAAAVDQTYLEALVIDQLISIVERMDSEALAALVPSRG